MLRGNWQGATGDVGRAVPRLDLSRVGPDETTNRALYKTPSRRAVTQSARRAKGSKYQGDVSSGGHHNKNGASQGVSAAMSNHEEPVRRARSERNIREVKHRTSEQWQGALTQGVERKRIGATGPSLHARDYHEMPLQAYKDALKTPAPAHFLHPEREWDGEDRERYEGWKNSKIHHYRNMAPRVDTSDRSLPAPPSDVLTPRSSAVGRREPTSQSRADNSSRSSRGLPAPASDNLTPRRSSSLRQAAEYERGSSMPAPPDTRQKSGSRSEREGRREPSIASGFNCAASSRSRGSLPGPPLSCY